MPMPSTSWVHARRARVPMSLTSWERGRRARIAPHILEARTSRPHCPPLPGFTRVAPACRCPSLPGFTRVAPACRCSRILALKGGFLGRDERFFAFRCVFAPHPPAPFSHKERRGILGVLMPETGDGTQGPAQKPSPVSSPQPPSPTSLGVDRTFEQRCVFWRCDRQSALTPDPSPALRERGKSEARRLRCDAV